MTIHDELVHFASVTRTILAIGVFDGVHQGHQHLFRRLQEESARRNCTPVVITFRNHPAEVLDSTVQIALITDLDERVRLIQRSGISQVITVEFTRELSKLGADEFVKLLIQYLDMVGIVVGPDFALGHRREGDLPILRSLGDDLGFTVTSVDPLVSQIGELVSSSNIRRSLAEGRIEDVTIGLGHAFSFEGKVISGVGRGKALGFPTANLMTNSRLAIPSDGVYATWAYIGNCRHKSATSIGIRPTFGAHGDRSIESYLMDFDDNLYGRNIRLEFISRLRDEECFADSDELINQMILDVAEARECLEIAQDNRLGI